MDFQTRSNNGALNTFSTLKEALDFAESWNSIVRELDEFTAPTESQLGVCIWKISFSLPSKERVRLVYLGGAGWVLRQMDDEVDKILQERKDGKT